MPSSQKLQILLKRNFTRMFIGWSSTNCTFFVLIWNSKWRPSWISDRHKKTINFVEDLPMTIPGQFGFNCSSGFREEAFWNIFSIGSNVKLSISGDRHWFSDCTDFCKSNYHDDPSDWLRSCLKPNTTDVSSCSEPPQGFQIPPPGLGSSLKLVY
jgi:hypothetical protein